MSTSIKTKSNFQVIVKNNTIQGSNHGSHYSKMTKNRDRSWQKKIYIRTFANIVVENRKDILIKVRLHTNYELNTYF